MLLLFTNIAHDSSMSKKKALNRNSDLFQNKRPKINNQDQLLTGETDRLDVKLALNGFMNEIHCMNMRSLLGQKRREYIRERVKNLGGKEPKRKYVNYKEYMVEQKANREQEVKRKEEERILGTQILKKKTVVKGRGRWTDGKVKFGPSLGRLKGGVLKVSESEINKITRNRK